METKSDGVKNDNMMDSNPIAAIGQTSLLHVLDKQHLRRSKLYINVNRCIVRCSKKSLGLIFFLGAPPPKAP